MRKRLIALVPFFLFFGAWPVLGQVALFGMQEIRNESLDPLPQWERVMRSLVKEHAVYDACSRNREECPSRGVAAWVAMIRSQMGQPLDPMLDSVNRYLNAWQYKEDIANYGRRDFWATPLQFLLRSGDCEDYAIAKYVTLRRLGIPMDRLRIVVLRDTKRDIDHAVLAVYTDFQVYILDNSRRGVVRQETLPQYVPYYSFNEAYYWTHFRVFADATHGGGW